MWLSAGPLFLAALIGLLYVGIEIPHEPSTNPERLFYSRLVESIRAVGRKAGYRIETAEAEAPHFLADLRFSAFSVADGFSTHIVEKIQRKYRCDEFYELAFEPGELEQIASTVNITDLGGARALWFLDKALVTKDGSDAVFFISVEDAIGNLLSYSVFVRGGIVIDTTLLGGS